MPRLTYKRSSWKVRPNNSNRHRGRWGSFIVWWQDAFGRLPESSPEQRDPLDLDRPDAPATPLPPDRPAGSAPERIEDAAQEFLQRATRPGARIVGADYDCDGRTDLTVIPEPGSAWTTLPVAMPRGEEEFFVMNDPLQQWPQLAAAPGAKAVVGVPTSSAGAAAAAAKTARRIIESLL